MRTGRDQKAALTRAKNKSPEAVLREAHRTVGEWDRGEWINGTRERPYSFPKGSWPDSWATWQVAVFDAYPWNRCPISDLRDLSGVSLEQLERWLALDREASVL